MTTDYLHVDGRDVNTRLRVNTLVNGRRNLADLAIQPNNIAFRTAISTRSAGTRACMTH